MPKVSEIIKTEALKSFKGNFKEITLKELKELRKNGTPSIIIKKDGNFFCSEVDASFSLKKESTKEHMCASSSADKDLCSRLNARPDKLGGCQKVRDKKECLERYPWIKQGYETINTKQEAFIVLECEHFRENNQKRPKYSEKEVYQLRKNLMEFYCI